MNWVMYLFNPKVENLIAALSRIVHALERHAARSLKNMEVHTQKIVHYQQLKDEALAEQAKAERVSAKLKELLS